MAHLPQTSRPIFLSSCFIKPVWLDMDANMDARICIFACMPASMWLCIFKGICGTIHVYINKIIYMYVCTCMFLLFACICMHSRVYLPPKLVLAEKQDWTILFTNGILMRRKFKEFTNLLNINQHHLRTHQSNKCKDVFQLFSRSQTSSGWAKPAPFSEYWEPMKCSKESTAPGAIRRRGKAPESPERWLLGMRKRFVCQVQTKIESKVGCKSFMFQ